MHAPALTAPTHPLGRHLLLVLLTGGGLLVLLRLAIGWLIQFPAPAGDGVLFASVAHYHCSSGRFETPIFPLDPSGGIRYVWHGIGHPALLSWLSPGCGVTGLFVAQSLIVMSAAVVAWLAVQPVRGRLLAGLLALTVFALLAKQGFRPETTATLLALLAEWQRHQRRHTTWIAAASLLAWVQPTTFILYGAYALLSTDRQELRAVGAAWRRWLPLLLGLQLLLWAAYPFPLQDLLQGLVLQGRSFAGRSDGTVFNYLIRSDFFPLFGLLFAAVMAWAVWRRPLLVLLLPLCWFYGWRVPPTYYNLVPVVGWLLLMLLVTRPTAAPAAVRDERLAAWLLVLGGVLASAGMAQANLRDAHSWLQYGASQEAASQRYQALLARGLSACEVPAHFTLMLPASAFVPSHTPTLRACTTAETTERRDLLTSAILRQRTSAQGCEHWPSQPGLPLVDHLFRSDAGYGFQVCPAAETAALAMPTLPPTVDPH